MRIVKNRPVNLDLRTIRFPLPAIVSILHRISGLLILICIPLLLWALTASLNSPESFYRLQSFLSSFWVKLMVWGILSATVYHIFAGVRHMLMDVGHGESLQGGRLGAKIVMLSSLITIGLIGVWLWG